MFSFDENDDMSDLPPFYRDRFRKIAQHEMGHYVLSRHFGFRTGEVSVRIDTFDSHQGGAEIEPYASITSLDELQEHLLRRMAILYAGALSENLSPGSPTKKITKADTEAAVALIEDPRSGAYVDHSKIRELRALLRNVRFPDTDLSSDHRILAELEELDREAWTLAISVIDQHYMLVVSLAALMTDRLIQLRQKVVMTAAELEANPAVRSIEPVSSQRSASRSAVSTDEPD